MYEFLCLCLYLIFEEVYQESLILVSEVGIYVKHNFGLAFILFLMVLKCTSFSRN